MLTVNGKAAGARTGAADAGLAEAVEGAGGGAGLAVTLALGGLDVALLAPSLWSLSAAIVSLTCLSLSTDADLGNTRWVSAWKENTDFWGCDTWVIRTCKALDQRIIN